MQQLYFPPGNYAPFKIFSPNIQQGVNASQISSLELLTTMPNPGNFSDSIETGTHERTTLRMLTLSHGSRKGSEACIHRIGDSLRDSRSASC